MPEQICEAQRVDVDTGDVTLEGELAVPEGAEGLVLFAHGSGSSRHSPRNQFVAHTLQEAGLATLLIDLLTPDEEILDRRTAHLRFDIPLLARRLVGATQWLGEQEATASLRVGYFGASTGAGAALLAAAERPDRVAAVVARGGRPDLAGEALPEVQAPTLLIVGERDGPVLALNEEARARMTTDVRLVTVPRAAHLFEAPGTLEAAAAHAADWFTAHLTDDATDLAPHALPEPSAASADAADDDLAASLHVYRSPAERAALIGEAAEPFDAIDTADLGPLMERVGDARVVLLGEASHGTSEFYRMRQRITQALIQRHGFTIVAAEADWPDAEHIDEYVRGRAPRPEREARSFARFPEWMWRNEDVLHFVEWLRAHNAEVDSPGRKVGFYGLDLYSLYSSIREVLLYLEQADPELARTARDRYSCLMPFQADPGRYGSAVVTNRYRDCEDEVAEMLAALLQKRLSEAGEADEQVFDAAQNARVVAGAEAYYRTMYYGAPNSWNLRDTHMFETLRQLLDFRGPEAKAVVWAHNSHIGDAAATEMSARGEINLGHLCRDHFGDDAYLIGFGTHDGTVAAASDWGGEVEVKQVRPSHRQSYEWLCHESEVAHFLLPLRAPNHPDLRDELSDPRLERAIGVIYRPETELQSHYFEADLPRQFDEYVWIDHTEAVRPLGPARAPELPERHPFLLAD